MGWTFGLTATGVFVLASIIAVKFFDLIQVISIASIDEYATSYQNSDLAESKDLNIIGIASFFLRSLLYPIIAIYLIKKTKEESSLGINKGVKEKMEYMLCWFVYISIVTLYIKLFYRFNNYLIPFWIITLSDVVFSKIKLHKKRLRLSFGLWILVLSPYLSLNIYAYFSDDSGSGINLIKRYSPYTSVLNPTKDEKREQLFRYLGGN